jgi:hypothetical protein
VNSTESSVTLEHSTWSGPAVTLSPSPQVTVAPPTLSDALPFCTPPKVRVVPRISAFAPSPLSVTVHELVEQLTPFSDIEQADSGNSRAPARRVAAIRGVGSEDMARA